MAEIGKTRGKTPPGCKPSLVQRFLISCIKFYRLFISPMIGPRCRFYPSCSQYAIEAITSHGPILGSSLTIKRLIRCQPLCAGGYDPVPHKHNTNPQQTGHVRND